jgi:hypothetical protein
MRKKYKTEEEKKEARSLYKKKWYEENKEKLKKYYEENKEKRNERSKKWREENKEKLKEYHKKWREDNKEKIREKKKKYYEENKEKIREREKKYRKNKRNSLRKAIKLIDGYKSKRTEEILGCSFKELKQHIESQWEDWMTWDNYGLYNGELNHGWDIDHIEPLSLCESEEDVYKLNHYTNLQPLCSYTNRYIKRDNIN